MIILGDDHRWVGCPIAILKVLLIIEVRNLGVFAVDRAAGQFDHRWAGRPSFPVS